MKKFTKSIFIVFILIITASIQAVEIVPRVGVAGGIYWLDDKIASVDDKALDGVPTTIGVNGGAAFVMQDSYFDLSFDILKYDQGLKYGETDQNMPNTGFRSEANVTYGHRVAQNIFAFVGYRQVGWEKAAFKNAATTQKGGFIGINLSNLEKDGKLNSFSIGHFFGKYDSPEGSADAEGFLFRASWREKGSNDLWSIKWSQIGTKISDIPLTFGYSYLFY